MTERSHLKQARGLELDRIAHANGGLLVAADVVTAARRAGNVLHDLFEWDDAFAGHAYRLQQARGLIEVQVTMLSGTSVTTRKFVSVSSDRKKEGGGYRYVEMVLSSDELAGELLAAFRRQLRALQRQYRVLREARSIFMEVNRVFPQDAPAKPDDA